MVSPRKRPTAVHDHHHGLNESELEISENGDFSKLICQKSTFVIIYSAFVPPRDFFRLKVLMKLTRIGAETRFFNGHKLGNFQSFVICQFNFYSENGQIIVP
jgi:hypothetical protein